MTDINKDIEKYLSQVKSYLPCRKADKIAILKDIRQAILEFTENSGAETIDDIYNRFGTPEEIAKAYLSDAEPQSIKKATNIRKIIISAVLIIAAMFSLGYLISYFIAVESQKNILFYKYESGELVSHYENWREKNNDSD